MALIKCPECEEKLSTEAKRCVHCGCEFTVCQECGAVLVGKAAVCSECGYVFVKKEDISNKTNPKRVTPKESDAGKKKENFSKGISSLKGVREKWEEECGKKNLKIFKMIILAICGICFAIAVIQFNSVEKWGFDYNDKMTLITAMFVIIGVMDVCYYVIMHGSDFFFIVRMPIWAESKKIDLNAPIVQYMQNIKNQAKKIDVIEEVNLKGCLRDILKALAFKDDYNIKNRFLGFKVFEFVLKAISSGFVWTFVILNVRKIADACFWVGIKLFFTETFSFSFIEYWWILIVGVVALVGIFLYNCFVEVCEEKSIDKWFRRNYSEYVNEYENYFIQPFENADK